MSILSNLKGLASSKLAAAHADVQAYVGELEMQLSANKKLLIGVAAVCLLIGAAVGHAV